MLMNFVRAMLPYAIIVIFAAACIALASFAILESSKRALTSLEATSLQVFILVTGVLSSYLFSQKAARMAARPQARSAFRRVQNLYAGLFYVKNLISEQKYTSPKDASHVVEIIEAVVDQQVTTVVDALEDWRDIIPEDVAELEERVRQGTKVELEDLRR